MFSIVGRTIPFFVNRVSVLIWQDYLEKDTCYDRLKPLTCYPLHLLIRQIYKIVTNILIKKQKNIKKIYISLNIRLLHF